MPTNSEAKAVFAQKVTGHFLNELLYYTDPDVQTTAHQPGVATAESWTQILVAQKSIPKPKTGERFIELERTLTSLYCLNLVAEHNYDGFTAAQPAHEKMNLTLFESLCADTNSAMPDDGSAMVLGALIVYSDLGKSPVTRAKAEKFGIDPKLDNDELILEILKLKDKDVVEILPSFYILKPKDREMLRKAYPMMRACFGHIYFLEGGQKTLETIAKGILSIHDPKEASNLLDLVFYAQFYDAIGAQGQANISGSLTCNDNFFKGYMLVRETVFNLEMFLRDGHSVEKAASEALSLFLEKRAKMINIKLSINQFSTRNDYEFVLRLACTLRIYDAETAKKLRKAFHKLPIEHQELLASQLSLNAKSGINAFTKSPHYVATMAQNISTKLFKENKIDEAITQALNAEICLAMLIAEINEKHSAIATQSKYPLSFGKLAFRASEKDFCDPTTFDSSLAVWALPRPEPEGKIKNLIFDLGHVFIRIDMQCKSVYEAFSQLAKTQGKTLPAEAVSKVFTKEITDSYHRGIMSNEVFRKTICDALELANVSNEDFDKAWTASIFASPETVKRRLDYLDGLVHEGYNIYLLSKNNEIHRIHTKTNYDGMHWGHYFFKQYYSNENGLCKPDAEAFRIILRENRLKAAETMFFDDVIDYVNAAWSVGIRGRQFTVNHPMTNIKFMIDATNQTDSKTSEKVQRMSAIGIFAVNKWLALHASRKVKIVSEEKAETMRSTR
jgi:FMN phosphatase YigB (HAD superfamily)